MTVWTEEAVRFENEYRREHLRHLAGHDGIGGDGVSAARHSGRWSTRSATWWRWLHASLRR